MKQRRAFATATAVVMLALLATLSLVLTSYARSQAARTTRDESDAQLRQLLHAGGLIAADLPTVWNTSGVQAQTLRPTLPSQLSGAAVSIAVRSADPDAAEAVVGATLGTRSASQTLRFARTAEGWKLSGVTRE